MKNINLVNMDFEKNFLNGLGKPGGRPLASYINPINHEFEYLAFLCLGNNPDDILCSQFPGQYGEEYLENLELFSPFPLVMGFDQLSGLDGCNLWWGSEENLPLARILNSKFTSANFMHQYPLYENLFSIIKTESELIERLNKELHLSGNNFIYKNAIGMSGSGHKFFKLKNHQAQKAISLKDLIKGARYPGIFMPLLERTFDLGIRVNDSGIFRVVVNKIDERGQFKGAFACQDQIEMNTFLSKNYHIDLNKYSGFYNDLWREYKSQGATDSIQVDCFGVNHPTLNFLPMVEINYRKTMGDVLVLLMEKVKKKGFKFSCAELLIRNNQRLNVKISPNIFRLTPQNAIGSNADLNDRGSAAKMAQSKILPHKFELFLVLANNPEELRQIKLENNLAD